MNPLNMLNNAEQAHLISILVLEADWIGGRNRMAFLDLLKKSLDEKAKQKKKLPAGWVWELPDGSYIKLPNDRNNGWYSLSNRMQFEGKGEQQ